MKKGTSTKKAAPVDTDSRRIAKSYLDEAIEKLIQARRTVEAGEYGQAREYAGAGAAAATAGLRSVIDLDVMLRETT